MAELSDNERELWNSVFAAYFVAEFRSGEPDLTGLVENARFVASTAIREMRRFRGGCGLQALQDHLVPG